MAESRTYSGNGYTATIADPEDITRSECVALARCGAQEGNAWRGEFEVRGGWPGPYKNCADFTGQDFSSGLFNFSEFKFGHCANFSESKFWMGLFVGAEFGHNTRFIGVQFGERTTFDGAKFGLETYFDRSEFDADSSLTDCELDARASFQGVRFGSSFNFRGTVFGDGVHFDWGHFEQFVSFQGVLFTGSATFIAVSVGAPADFSGLMAGGALSFESAMFEGQTTLQGLSWGALKQELQLGKGTSALEEHAKEWHAGPWDFKAINFRGARFGGSVDFSDRHFEGVTEFSKTEFDSEARGLFGVDDALARHVRNEPIANEHSGMYLPEGRRVQFALAPDFFQCKLHQNQSFEGAEFPIADVSEEAARAHRVLKLAFSQQQATREEQRFFRLEMAEEAKAAERSRDPTRWLYSAYRDLADFGFSVQRPVLLLLATLFVMLPLYAVQAGLHLCWPGSSACSKTGPLLQFATAHALPGFEKPAEPASRALFGDHLGVWTVRTLLLHKAVSLLALFLIGLALRNLFKMK